MKAKMAIIGDGDSVVAFSAGGVDAYSVSSPDHAREVLKSLVKN
ncbi:MAG: V-type ATP synthase subunit F, partial [Clostridia bacterium]|nr:V-type ATP synthase subunit F [Clostridia bacterium]